MQKIQTALCMHATHNTYSFTTKWSDYCYSAKTKASKRLDLKCSLCLDICCSTKLHCFRENASQKLEYTCPAGFFLWLMAASLGRSGWPTSLGGPNLRIGWLYNTPKRLYNDSLGDYAPQFMRWFKLINCIKTISNSVHSSVFLLFCMFIVLYRPRYR